MLFKRASKEDKDKMTKRLFIMGDKAAPGYITAKAFIRLANQVACTINNDEDVNQYLKAVFLPNYSVSLAQIIIPAADISQHISTAGTEASGTRNMKFAMTGSLIIGTRDGANIEVADEIGEENVYFFGKTVEEVEEIRQNHGYSRCQEVLIPIINYILQGTFGDIEFIKSYLQGIVHGSDFYLTCSDFEQYIDVQHKLILIIAFWMNGTKRL